MCRQPQQHAMMRQSSASASTGDVCTIELELKANHGFVPDQLFDASGRISLVLDYGNYLPAIHELVRHCDAASSSVRFASIDAGYGAYREDLVFALPRAKLDKIIGANDKNNIHIGDRITLHNSVDVTVLHVDGDDDTVTLDANHPLAGASYDCRLRLVAVEPSPWSHASSTSSSFQVATFALGCFWGAELFFMRIPGVVGTRVGYVSNNSQENANTTEAVQVIFDTRQVSYRSLVSHALSRSNELRESVLVGSEWLWNHQNEDNSEIDEKYRHGIYCHSAEHERVAQQQIMMSSTTRIPLIRLTCFETAAPDQQQYLYKRGQSARKGAKEPIRCFG